MNPAWQLALGRVVREVLEQQCFMLPGESGAAAPEEARVVLEVDFEGARRGVLRLSLPDRMIEPIAQAMLGEDAPLPLEDQYDAVRELANIVCGNALPLVLGERVVCELATPRVIARRGGEPPRDFDAEIDVSLEEGVVHAAISVSDGPDGAA